MKPDLVTVRAVGDDRHEQPRGAGPVEADLERSYIVDQGAARIRRLGPGVVRHPSLPSARDRAEEFEHAGTDHVQQGVATAGDIFPHVPDAVLDEKRIARDHFRGHLHFLDLQPGPVLLGLLVHQVDGEVEVGPQGLVVAFQVGGCLDEVDACLQVLDDAGVATLPAIVVGADDAAQDRRQGQHRIAVLRCQVDAHATGLLEAERVSMSGMLNHEARPARIERPGSGRGQVGARCQRAEMHRLTSGNLAHGEGEVRSSAAPAPGRRCLYQVHAGQQVSLDAGVQPGAAVVIVSDAGAVLREQVKIGVRARRRQVDPDPYCRRHPEPVGVGVAGGAEP